jgi:hypothetical protein
MGLSIIHKTKIAEAIRKRHREGLQPKVVRCLICGSFLGKNHNCEEIKKKFSETRKQNPIRYWLGKKRDKKTCQAISNAQKKREHSRGKDCYNWIGSFGWYHNEARKIMEKQIGRQLEKTEIVHHINGNWKDNSPENLKIVSRSEHINIHRKSMRRTQ